LEGKRFLDFVAPEDAESFEALVSVDPVARKKHEQDVVAPATSVNLNLLDSNGRRILVRIFHRSFLDSTGQIKHLISVREERATEEDDDSPATRATVLEADASETEARCPHLVELSKFDFSGGSSSAEEGSDRDDALIAKAELDKGSLKIVSCSTAFTFICGPCAQGENLMDWVSGAQRETFQRWFEHTGNVVYCTNRDVMDSSAEACFLALKLKPVSIEHTVNCEVVGASFEHREEGHDAFILKLCFTILEKPRRGQRARKKLNNIYNMSKESPVHQNSRV